MEIATLKDEKFEAEQEVRALEKEVGPIKYVAQLLFGGDDAELLDKAVQVFILMLVFVFDPLAVMLVIAANQTLLRYGINLEKAGPNDGSGTNKSNELPQPSDTASGAGETSSEADNKNTAEHGGTTDNDLHLQPEGTSGVNSGEKSSNQPSAVDDAATAMAEAAAQQKKEIAKLKRELKKKPKEVIKEVVKEVEVEADEVDINLRAPKGIKALEKKLEKRLNKDGD